MMNFQHNVTREYNLNKNKRVFIDPMNGKKKVGFSMKMSFNLLPQLTDEYRTRHKLSIMDYRKIFKSMDVNQMWLMVLYNGLEITTSAIQSSNSTDDITYSNATQFKNKLEAFLQTKKLSTTNCLVVKHDHKLPLPVHFISNDALLSIKDISPRCLNVNLSISVYPYLYKFKDIYLVPFGYYAGYLKMIRVVPRHYHEHVYSKSRTLFNRPYEYLVDGMVYYGLSEYVLFQTLENHNFISKSTDSKFIESLHDSLYLPGK